MAEMPAAGMQVAEFFIVKGLEETQIGSKVRLDIAVIDMDGALFRGGLMRARTRTAPVELVGLPAPASAVA